MMKMKYANNLTKTINQFHLKISSKSICMISVILLSIHVKSILESGKKTFSSTQYKQNTKVVWNQNETNSSNTTLRQFLSHPDGFHLAMAPSFFGFYGYYGALTAIHELALSENDKKDGKYILPVHPLSSLATKPLLKSVAGASSGAMAAILIAAGLNPRVMSEVASSMTLGRFADPPGVMGLLKGNLFEKIMVDILKMAEYENGGGLIKAHLEHGLVPVAVTGYDLIGMEGKVLTHGCMGRAARASATFPGLFEPVTWNDSIHPGKEQSKESRIVSFIKWFFPASLLVDGGVADPFGLVGLSALLPDDRNKRIVNIVVGNFGKDGALGPSMMPKGIHSNHVVSISIENTPNCGPWAMENGPLAVRASMEAVRSALDTPMRFGNEEGHYLLPIDTSKLK